MIPAVLLGSIDHTITISWDPNKFTLFNNRCGFRSVHCI